MANVVSESDSQPNGSYSIAAPGVLRSNANYNVAVSLLDVPEPSDVQISLSGGNFRLEKIVTIQPLSTELLCFEIPDLDPDEVYFLDAESLTGIEFNDTIELLFEKGHPLAYVQFDKQAYKRGDKVDFRVLLLEHERLKPFRTDSPIAVCLKHKDKLIFEKIVELEKGTYTDHWLISDDVSHGCYDMQIFVGEALISTKSFEIIDFTKPKFNVEIKAPKELVYAQKQFHVDVEAHYFDGTSVNGTCKLEIASVAGFFSGVCIEKYMPIYGNIETTIIDVVDDLDIDSDFIDSEWFSTATIMVKATVNANNTNDQETLTKLIVLKRNESVRYEEENELCNNCRRCMDCNNCCEMDTDNYFEEEENDHSIKITVTAPKINNIFVGDIIHFNIQLKKQATHCMYFVTARGNIIKSEFIKVEDYNVPITLSIETTFIYVPRAFILAYFIYDGILYFDEIGINLTKAFNNELTLDVPHNASPNTVVPIEIKSAPNSLVGIMAVDSESVVINADNDLCFENFFKDLYYVRSQVPEMNASGRYPGLMSGIVTLTNARMDGFEPDESEDGRYSFFPDREHIDEDNWRPRLDIERKKKKILRQMQEKNQVFGNWLFVNKETDNNGQLKFDAVLPDKPSLWLLTAFAVSLDKGFGMTKQHEKLCTKTTIVTNNTLQQSRIRVSKSQLTKFVFDHYDNDISRRIITLAPPPNVTPTEITLSINENLFGPVIAHLKEFAGKMYCTGYLHMTTVTPNVAVLEYLDKIQNLDSELACSIKVRFPEAIKRDLEERRVDNSFGWFRSDKDGSPHVTSLVLQTFQRAAQYVDIDSEIIQEGLAYLSSLQLENGEILKENQPYKNLFEKGSCVGLTSFVLLAFLKDQKIQQQYKTFIDKSFAYIIANIKPIKCVYDLAIAFYAIQLYNHDYADTLKEYIFKIANKDLENSHMWWPYSLTPNSDPNYYTAVSELEVTSYIALGLLETEPIEVILPILKWMLPLKDLRSESMDCGLALEVILKAAVKANATGIMDIAYTAFTNAENYNGTINLTPENSGKIQMHVLPKSTEKIEFSTKDNGSFYGYISYRYLEN